MLLLVEAPQMIWVRPNLLATWVAGVSTSSFGTPGEREKDGYLGYYTLGTQLSLH